ncbi:SIS domain-containing protein [Candidatus Woesearchaeota archaeon]|nr:SIS domain-containing protein [Candidatus Woesearchaeota archaeon]
MMNFNEQVKFKILESAKLVGKLEEYSNDIVKAAEIIIDAYKNGKKLLIAGNGGSAADAQHISAELVNSFYKKRKALPALALTTDTSIITAWGNDVNFDRIFERQVEAYGVEGDVLLIITTSGNSKNLLYAISQAKKQKVKTISLLGKGGGLTKGMSDHEIIVPHMDTARIQEAQHVIYHLICDLIEQGIMGGE